ncbi:MAG: hypothetical protein E6Q97_27605 [Desulfurellales bacterium]|nr:MAG: hypothetical protein E6Q97_27605 [Desulfurellales bacterium]
MVTIPGPADVRTVQPGVTRRVVNMPYQRAMQPAAEGAATARATGAVADAASEIARRASDQQIENEVAAADMRQRKEIDALVAELRADPDWSTYETRFAERSSEITQRNSESLSSRRAREIWRERTTERTYAGQTAIRTLARERQIENGRAGLISNVNAAEQTVQDPNATPEARALALEVIQTQVQRAVERGIVAEDDGATMIARAQNAHLQFERTRGMRARAQAEEDRIWAESGGNLGVALEMARDIDDVELRDLATDRIEARFSQSERTRQDSVRNALESAFSHIEGGGTLDGLSAGVRDVLTRAGQMDSLRTYARQRTAGGGGIPNEESEYIADSLLAAAEEDRRAFARADLNEYMPRMNPDDRRRVREHQQYLRGETPNSESGELLTTRVYNDIIAIARPLAERSGIAVTGQAERTRETRGQFETYMMGAARRFVAENARRPNASEIDEIARTALLEARTPGVFGMGRQTRRVFENRMLGSGDNAVPGVRVRYSDIPEWEVRRLMRVWATRRKTAKTHDEPPTEAQIEEMYARDTAGE